MSVKFANNAHSTLASSVSTSATSITVASGHGARFPSLSGSEFFYATLIDTSNNLEIVKVTARSTDVLTATRAQESTSARAFASGDRIELRVTAQGLTDATTIQADQVVNSMIATDAVNSDSIAANAVTASELNISGNGTAGQSVISDGDGSFSYNSISTNTTGVALLEYQDTAARFTDISTFGVTSGDRITIPFNTVFDPYNIIGTTGSNVFRVNASCAYHVSIYIMKHTMGHHKMYLYNTTNNKFAPRPVAALTSGESFQAPLVSYNVTQGYNANPCDIYYLETGVDYSVRMTNDGSQVFGTNRSDLFGNYAINGVTSRNTVMRACITKLAGV